MPTKNKIKEGNNHVKEIKKNSSAKKNDYIYEDRYVAFIDILGWSIKTEGSEVSNQIKDTIDYLSSQDKAITDYHNREYGNDALQFVFCSDSIFMSSVYENQIVSIGNTVRKFLSIGLMALP
jgi:hypothetical protein